MRITTQPRTAAIKLSMDPDTKKRLVDCAAEQHKSVSQLVTDWAWSCKINADTEEEMK